MTRLLSVVLVGVSVLGSGSAEARFGKKKAQPPPSSSHGAEAVGQNSAGSSPTSGGDGGGSSGYGHRHYRRSHGSVGFWTGAFVPRYGYGYAVVAAPAPMAVVEPVEEEVEQPSTIRLGAGLEGQGFRNGFTVGLTVGIEGDRWGFVASGQNIAVLWDDGRGFDHLRVATAHLTFAFLTGRYGRLRVEGGADAVFAPDLIVVGPTGGLSGTLWIGGPFAIEGAVMVTPWPYQQFDAKLGLALGLGPVGLRAGARVQVLEDPGLVDGVPNRDVFLGPYVGLAIVF